MTLSLSSCERDIVALSKNSEEQEKKEYCELSLYFELSPPHTHIWLPDPYTDTVCFTLVLHIYVPICMNDT